GRLRAPGPLDEPDRRLSPPACSRPPGLAQPRCERPGPPTLASVTASEFTHLDPLGRARMVDVTAKDATHRRAIARCRVHMEADTAAKIASGAISKGDVLAVARVAGIQAAKQTPNLLPLCHPLLVGS